jgi:hypothetical protein
MYPLLLFLPLAPFVSPMMLGSYSTEVSTTHAYDMTVFYLCGCSVWLNSPTSL